MKSRYAVVRSAIEFKFTKWHETYNEAKAEAERLCRKERMPFTILKEMAFCYTEEIPVNWTELSNDL